MDQITTSLITSSVARQLTQLAVLEKYRDTIKAINDAIGQASAEGKSSIVLSMVPDMAVIKILTGLGYTTQRNANVFTIHWG